MQIIDLTGVWNLSEDGDSKIRNIPVTIPGGVHPALINAGIIPDPLHTSEFSESINWIEERTWIFERPFYVDEYTLCHEIVDLNFDGIDTLANVYINGTKILSTDNMFKTWQAEVKSLLHTGENSVRVEILPSSNVENVHKAKYGFGSKYSPKCVTAGICRPVKLCAWNKSKISDFGFSQHHYEEEVSGETLPRVSLHIGGWLETSGETFSGLEMIFKLYDENGVFLQEKEGRISGEEGAYSCEFDILEPKYWWLNGMGEQPLYKVEGLLREKSSKNVLDRVESRVGLRELEICERDGKSFLVCNGVDVFPVGGVWIPPGIFPSHITEDDYSLLVGSAADANLNVFKIWDGGTFENKSFFDLCDEYGIAVLGLSDAYYETDLEDTDWYRISSHACLPDVSYSENGEEIDVKILNYPVSYPMPDVLLPCLPLGRRNISGYELQQRTADGNSATLVSELSANWPVPSSLENWIWLSQISHAKRVCEEIEDARVDFKQGVLWEPYSSCWAMADGSSIDSDGNWKALHYMVRKATADIAVWGRYKEDKTIDVYLSNKTGDSQEFNLVWRVTTLDGTIIDEGTSSVEAQLKSTKVVSSIDIKPFLGHYTEREIMVWLYLNDEEDFTVSDNRVILVAPRLLAIEDPNITVDVGDTVLIDGEETIKVTISTSSPALWVWLELFGEQAQFSDNFFCVEADELVDIYVIPVNRMTQYTFRKLLKVHSLFDMF